MALLAQDQREPEASCFVLCIVRALPYPPSRADIRAVQQIKNVVGIDPLVVETQTVSAR